MSEVMKIHPGDLEYPRLLRPVKGCPKCLYVLGKTDVLQQSMVAVIGSRKMSQLALTKVKEVVKELVGMKKIIVSGLARGIDKMAHEAALEYGGKTIAVLAHGLDMVYPAEHEKLAEKIVARGGALVSEFPMGVRPQRRFFLERNRIMVGMSEALVVIEAEVRSGSMASANYAADMGRDVLAIPGTPGTDLLISEGAIKLV